MQNVLTFSWLIHYMKLQSGQIDFIYSLSDKVLLGEGLAGGIWSYTYSKGEYFFFTINSISR